MPAVELGSILDRDSGGPRGRDLNVRVKVPSRALGRAEGWDVAVPLQLDVDGARVARAVSPHDKGRHVKLNLPKVLPAGAVLRLRGQGEAKTDGAHGDLYVHVEVQDPKWPAIVVMLVAFLAGAIVAAFALR